MNPNKLLSLSAASFVAFFAASEARAGYATYSVSGIYKTTSPGGPVKTYTDLKALVSDVANEAEFDSNGAPRDVVINLGDQTYTVDRPIVLARGHITITGAVGSSIPSSDDADQTYPKLTSATYWPAAKIKFLANGSLIFDARDKLPSARLSTITVSNVVLARADFTANDSVSGVTCSDAEQCRNRLYVLAFLGKRFDSPGTGGGLDNVTVRNCRFLAFRDSIGGSVAASTNTTGPFPDIQEGELRNARGSSSFASLGLYGVTNATIEGNYIEYPQLGIITKFQDERPPAGGDNLVIRRNVFSQPTSSFYLSEGAKIETRGAKIEENQFTCHNLSALTLAGGAREVKVLSNSFVCDGDDAHIALRIQPDIGDFPIAHVLVDNNKFKGSMGSAALARPIFGAWVSDTGADIHFTNNEFTSASVISYGSGQSFIGNTFKDVRAGFTTGSFEYSCLENEHQATCGQTPTMSACRTWEIPASNGSKYRCALGIFHGDSSASSNIISKNTFTNNDQSVFLRGVSNTVVWRNTFAGDRGLAFSARGSQESKTRNLVVERNTFGYWSTTPAASTLQAWIYGSTVDNNSSASSFTDGIDFNYNTCTSCQLKMTYVTRSRCLGNQGMLTVPYETTCSTQP